MIFTLAIILAVAICCVIGFIKGWDERKLKDEEAIAEIEKQARPRDPKTGRFIKKEEK